MLHKDLPEARVEVNRDPKGGPRAYVRDCVVTAPDWKGEGTRDLVEAAVRDAEPPNILVPGHIFLMRF